MHVNINILLTLSHVLLNITVDMGPKNYKLLYQIRRKENGNKMKKIKMKEEEEDILSLIK